MMSFRQIFLASFAVVLAACQTQQTQQAQVHRAESVQQVQPTQQVQQAQQVQQVQTEQQEPTVLPPIEAQDEPEKVERQKVRRNRKTKVNRKKQVRESQESAAPVKRSYAPRKPGRRVSRVNVPGKYVAVTFDDGPSPVYTPQVLDILKRHGARATFFVVGRSAAKHKSLLARAVAEGHEIANHTYTHIKMTASSRKTVASEIERTTAAIKAATGYEPTVMRPPYGAVNSGLVDMMYNDYGFYTVLWDVDTRDWQKPGVSKVVSRAVGQAEPGSIILLHDIHASTLAAVEQIVVGLQQRGYKLVTVSQLIAMGRRASGEGGPATPEDAAPAEIPVGLAPIDVVSSEPTAAAEISGQPAEQPAMTTSETN